ncbi:PucR family transcriptional regulator [Streptomyces sp. NPDC021098]|uniref:PucR family transcriptional regulator n=1 Tax=unclassified Streptomyces TaxID=2593676 RepID=UPI0037934D94
MREGKLVVLTSAGATDAATCQRLAIAVHQVAGRRGISIEAVGLSGPLRDAADGLQTSIRQAEFTARVAARVPEMERQACWEALGEYRLFYSYEWNSAGVAAIDPGVAVILSQEHSPLAQTVLAYLDRQGDVNATAAALNVHRTTLYYRLNQVAGLIGQDLNGPARFRIHAALRLAQLSNL